MSQELQDFQSTLVYERQATVDDLLVDLETVRRIDVEHEGKQSKSQTFGCTGLVAALACGVGAMFLLAENSESLGTAVGVGAVVALIASIVFFIRAAMFGKLNYENRRYELMSRVLGLLGTDIGPDVAISSRLDLDKTDRKSKLQREGKAGVWDVKYYQDPFLHLRGKLLDGSRFDLTVIDKLQKRSRWKRSISGKMKHKTKEKSAAEAILKLTPKTSRYSRLETLGPEAEGAVQLPRGVLLKSLQATPEGFVLRATTPEPWTAPPPDEPEEGLSGNQMVAMMFLSLYQVLNLSRAMDKESSG